MLRKILFYFIASAAGSLAAASPLKEAMIRDLDFIDQTFNVRYAPAEWKQKFSNGWTMLSSIENAKAQVNAIQDPTLKDYHRVLQKVFTDPRDYHVSVRFYSTERAVLPFQVMGHEGKYYIVWMDRAKLGSVPMELGDEVVEFDGKKTQDVVQSLKTYLGHNVEETDQALAELYLTRRAGAIALDVPQGPVSVTFKSKNGEAKTAQLVWEYTPELIPDLGQMGGKFNPLSRDAHKKPFSSLADIKMEPGFWSVLKDTDKQLAGENPFGLGTRRSFIPALGPKIWESAESNHFYAYIYKNADNKLIGYVRIAAYDGAGDETKEFVAIIQRMQQVTDGLVIDQIHNPGGSVFYLYALVSTLTDKPMRTPTHRMTNLQEDVAEALTEIPSLQKVKSDAEAVAAFGTDNVGGYPVNYQTAQFFLNFLSFKVKQFWQGKTLTDPYYLGIDQIMPHSEVSYTKPILIVVDQLDFSGGDFFPAIMQDNKRATIMGTRTAGAGGYIVPIQYQNILGVQQFVVTGSIAERVDLNPIENLGVTPDIQYTLTEDDVRGGFHNYAQEIKKTISDLVK